VRLCTGVRRDDVRDQLVAALQQNAPHRNGQTGAICTDPIKATAKAARYGLSGKRLEASGGLAATKRADAGLSPTPSIGASFPSTGPLIPHSPNRPTLTAGETLAVWGTLMIAMIGRTQFYEIAALAVFAAMVLVFTSQIVPALVD
jgi:hypothetical protein